MFQLPYMLVYWSVGIQLTTIPIGSMYGICTYISFKNQPNVGNIPYMDPMESLKNSSLEAFKAFRSSKLTPSPHQLGRYDWRMPTGCLVNRIAYRW